MSRWLLCDYGEVLSLAPPAADWARLVAAARAAGWESPAGAPETEERFHAIYWADRPGYDRGDLTASEYWASVLGRVPANDHLESLIRADQAIWLHPNNDSVDAARRSAAGGYRLAVFSNAPVEIAAQIDTRPWLADFGPRFFSCHLRAVKPEPRAYEAVLEGLGAQPHEVTFFDDRPANVAAARAVGIDGRLFERASQLDLGAVPER